MFRQTAIAETLDIATYRAQYDEYAKKLLAQKVILAWLLKSCAREFASLSVEYIMDNCIEGKPEISSKTVHQDQLDKRDRIERSDKPIGGDEAIQGMNTEDKSIRESTVYFDIRFSACFPEKEDLVQLIVNVEIQLDDSPGYPLVKRGFYYCSRMISAQYGTVFKDSHYEKIKKVYSIWICPEPARKRRNSIFRYHTAEDCIYGQSYTAEVFYDLMEVIIINLGDAREKSGEDILDLLNILLSENIIPDEKKKILQDMFQIAMTAEFEREVQGMGSVVDNIYIKGEAKGADNTKVEIAKMMIKDNKPVSEIIRYTRLSKEKLKEIAQSLEV